MWDRLTAAAADGLVLGVKWAIVIIVIGTVVAYIATDYNVTRARALNGQMAHEFIQQQITAQQQAAPPKQPPEEKQP